MSVEQRSRSYALQAVDGMRLVAELSDVDYASVTDAVCMAFGTGYTDATAGVHSGYAAIVCAGAAFRALAMEANRGMVVLEDVVSVADVAAIVSVVTGAYAIGHAAYRDDQSPGRPLVDSPRRRGCARGRGVK